MTRYVATVPTILFALLVAACGERQLPASTPLSPEVGLPPSSVRAHPYFAESGVASWYGGRHHGRRTASGERFDMNAMTAAHKRLPMGTVVRVTNLSNERTVTVRINDRGPFTRGRIIDLSAAAARALGMHRDGLAQVRIEAFAADQGDPEVAISGRSPAAVPFERGER